MLLIYQSTSSAKDNPQFCFLPSFFDARADTSAKQAEKVAPTAIEYCLTGGLLTFAAIISLHEELAW